jgi:nuclear pore complex protein Nup62
VFGGGTTGANNTTTSGSTPLFGGGLSNPTGNSTGSFGGGGPFGAPKATDASAPKAATSSFFTNPSTTSTAATPGSAPAGGQGIFGSTPKPAENTPASTGGLFGGGNLFGKKSEEQAPWSSGIGTSSAPKSFFSPGVNDSSAVKDSVPAPAAPAGGIFGLTPKEPEKSSTPAPASLSIFGTAKDTSAEKKDAPAAPASLGLFGAPKDASTEKKDAPAAPASLGLFGAPKDASAEKKDTPAAPASLGLFGGPKDTSSEKKDTSSGLVTLGLGQPSTSKEGDKSKDASAAPAANVSVPLPSMLKGKTIEEIVNRWSIDLETHVREFNKFAGEVAVWDRSLIENGNNLAALYSHVLAAEQEQSEIDQSLDHIEQQQKDLSATLDAYEKSMEEVLGGQGGSLRALDTGPADNERDKNYMLATELHTHLDDLSGSLTQMIDSVNSLSLSPSASGDGKTQQGEDPMTQIAQILSSHLESLQWIDGAVREVESKITEVEKGVREAGIGGGPGLSGANKSRGFGLNR